MALRTTINIVGACRRVFPGARLMSSAARPHVEEAQGTQSARQTHFGFETVDEQEKWKKGKHFHYK